MKKTGGGWNPKEAAGSSSGIQGDADDLESDGDRNAGDPRLRGVWAADRNRKLYEICVASWKQREYGGKGSETASRGRNGGGVPTEKRPCTQKRGGGIHKAFDPDVSHAGDRDDHGGRTGIFITVEMKWTEGNARLSMD